MKLILALALFLFLVILPACGEDGAAGTTGGGTGGTPAVTTYQVANSTGFSLPEVYTYFWNTTTEVIEDFQSHGALAHGATTSTTPTTRGKISIALRLVSGGVLYLVTSPKFLITEGQNNVYTITGETLLYGGAGKPGAASGVDRQGMELDALLGYCGGQ